MLLVLAVQAYASPAHAIVSTLIYVDADAPGVNDGTTWKNAYTDLQSALAAATPSDTIWVAEGVYSPGSSPFDTFSLVDGVEVYGGFNGSETSMAQRDWVTNLVILSGDIGGDDTTTADGIVTDPSNIVGTNTHVVVTGSSLSGTVALDGFIVTAGSSTSFGSTTGGILISAASPTIRNTTIIGNHGVDGGGIHITSNSNPLISNVTVSNNQANSRGGGIYIKDTSQPSLENVLVTGNVSLSQGGGIYSTNSDPQLTNVAIKGNRTAIDGGGIFIGTSSSSVLNNILVSGNSAANSSGSEGGGIYFSDSTTTVTNLTIVGNFAALGGGIAAGHSFVSVNNSIIWGNGDNNTPLTASSYENFASHIQIKFSDIENLDVFQDGGDNIDIDPLFASSINSTAAPTAGGDFQLQSASAAIDAGSSTLYTSSVNSDLAGNPRVKGAAIDMGAYESDFIPLNLTLDGAGAGTVTGNGINCPTDCVEGYTLNSTVTLTASADTGSNFAGWDGASGCSSNPVCTLTMDVAKNVIATFNLNSYGLTAVVSPANGGTLTSSPAGINCPSDCNETYSYGDVITLTPTAAQGYQFIGWGGAGGCTGLDPCDVTIDTAKLVRADFAPLFSLDVGKSGDGTGVVTSDPVGIDCGSSCTMSAVDGTLVTLSPSADTGSIFTGWSGDCTGTGSCVVALDASKTVTASFGLVFDLTVNKTGGGGGSIMSLPAGISCGLTCTVTAQANSTFTLTATADSGSLFTGWSGGGCSGTDNCLVTVDEAKTVSANFDQLFELTVTKSGDGSGSVTSNLAGIDCESSCTTASMTVSEKVSVTLSATADSDSLFVGWSGAGCSGSSDCTVTMNEAKSVTATFAKIYTLSVAISGDGAGQVADSTDQIACGPICSLSAAGGTVITLTATAEPGSVFVGWSGGGCSGTATCSVTLDGTKSVTADFEPSGYSIYLPLIGRP